jgi:hypothetical protein
MASGFMLILPYAFMVNGKFWVGLALSVAPVT